MSTPRTNHLTSRPRLSTAPGMTVVTTRWGTRWAASTPWPPAPRCTASPAAIGEIAGLIIGTALGLSTIATIGLAVSLAFLFGYTLSTLPLVRAGLGFFGALGIVLAADTLSIATMELVDNAVMAAIPGAMDAGLSNPVFWIGMMVALTAAGIAAYPVNRYLLGRGKGHALTHGYHGGAEPTGWRRFVPAWGTGALVAVIVAFMLGGLVVAATSDVSTGGHGAARDVSFVRETSWTPEAQIKGT